MNRQEILGRWNEVKGRVKEKWGQVTDDDLAKFNGNTDQLVGVIQQRTGEARQQVERFVSDLFSEGSNVVNRVADTAREYAQQAGETVREYAGTASEAVKEGIHEASDQVRAGYRQAEQTVRRNPMESIAVALGAGVITGLVIGLCMRSR